MNRPAVDISASTEARSEGLFNAPAPGSKTDEFATRSA